MENNEIEILNQKMESSLTVYNKNIASVRAGRASPELLEHIQVEAYGNLMPLNQLSTVSVQDSNMLTIQVWDKSHVALIEKTISSSDLALNPATDGNLIRIPLPKLSEERRVELTKVCSNYAEQAKISIRNIRRDVIDNLKKQEKNGDFSQDDLHKFMDDIQKITDEFIVKIDDVLNNKKAEIMKV